MKLKLISISIIFLLFSCTEDGKKDIDSTPTSNVKEGMEESSVLDEELPKGFKQDTIKTDALFTIGGFDDKLYYELLIETHLCNPNYSDTTSNGSTPCSSRFFSFYPYNHKRKIEDAFLLQIKAGVNNYPYRRLLI